MAGAGINREDEPGFDPFEEPDEYREANPAHEPVPIGSFIPQHLLEPPAGSTQPPALQVRCGVCHKLFMARAGWFFGKWRHSSLCGDCADGISLPSGFLAECDSAKTVQMHCPNCGVTRGVEGRCKFNMWEYTGDCSHCGHSLGVALLRLRRKCEVCQEKFYVDDRYPRKTCHKCSEHKKAF